jgi:hypothetical protein
MSLSRYDPWALYSETRDALIELLRSLTPEQASQRVRLTPEWTIADAASHVCGINADVGSGRLVGLGTDTRTAHQVAARAGHTLEDICREWIGHGTAMHRAIESDADLGHRLAGDLIVHLHDIRHTLGLPIDRADHFTADAAHTYAAITVERLLDQCQIAIIIELTDGTRFEAPPGSNHPVLTIRTTPYDFLRSVTGRRSHSEVQALDWIGDPTTVLDDLSPYGPLRVCDAGV